MWLGTRFNVTEHNVTECWQHGVEYDIQGTNAMSGTNNSEYCCMYMVSDVYGHAANTTDIETDIWATTTRVDEEGWRNEQEGKDANEIDTFNKYSATERSMAGWIEDLISKFDNAVQDVRSLLPPPGKEMTMMMKMPAAVRAGDVFNAEYPFAVGAGKLSQGVNCKRLPVAVGASNPLAVGAGKLSKGFSCSRQPVAVGASNPVAVGAGKPWRKVGRE